MPVVVFSLWTLFVWGTRIRNADGAVGATGLALTFVLLAVLVLAWRARRPQLVAILAGWTVAVWDVRVPAMWFGDRSIAFKVVHTVLAVISIALAGWVVFRRPAQDAPIARSVSGSKK